MKRVLIFLLAIIFFLTSCSSPLQKKNEESRREKNNSVILSEINENPKFKSLGDEKLLTYIESTVYAQLIDELNDKNYYIENVSAQYFSQEYLDELNYNSQENVYFGYTLSELEKQFKGEKYVFYYNDDSKKTDVKKFEKYDDTYEKALKNVVIGTGAILVCVTASVMTGGAAPSISIIFATSAKTGTSVALSSGVISGAAAGIIKGLENENPKEIIKVAAIEGSEGFKWGAISGIISGGVKGKAQVSALKGGDVTANGLTLKEAAKIQKESKYPLDVIRQMHSMEEYKIYKDANLKAVIVNGKTALIPDIDLNYKSKMPDGSQISNLERMKRGSPPLDSKTKKVYQLHHIGQKSDATLAVLTPSQHQGNSKILNIIGKETEINRPDFAKVRKAFWKDCGNRVFARGAKT